MREKTYISKNKYLFHKLTCTEKLLMNFAIVHKAKFEILVKKVVTLAPEYPLFPELYICSSEWKELFYKLGGILEDPFKNIIPRPVMIFEMWVWFLTTTTEPINVLKLGLGTSNSAGCWYDLCHFSLHQCQNHLSCWVFQVQVL